jgi:hypothetical protein
MTVVEPPSDAADRAPHTVAASDFEDEELKAALAQPETTKRELYSWYAYGKRFAIFFSGVADIVYFDCFFFLFFFFVF